jgi:hypothetical protein
MQRGDFVGWGGWALAIAGIAVAARASNEAASDHPGARASPSGDDPGTGRETAPASTGR